LEKLNPPESVNEKPKSSAGQSAAKEHFQRFQAFAAALIRVPKAEVDRKAKQLHNRRKKNP
jgi:hypothetical protein